VRGALKEFFEAGPSRAFLKLVRRVRLSLLKMRKYDYYFAYHFHSGKDTKVSPSRVDPKGRFPEGQIIEDL
jgi:hypothetical protein